MKIAIIGMMGSGKTELGKMLASHYGIDFVDLDQAIEKRSKMCVSDLFSIHGEDYFRARESDALVYEAHRSENIVLSCGGGVILSESNCHVLKERFLTIWLDVPLSELQRRLEHERERRPLLATESWKRNLETILSRRECLYQKATAIHYRWSEGESEEESVRAIEKKIDLWFLGKQLTQA